MSEVNAPNIVDYLTLAAAVVSPVLTAALTVWTTRRSDRERMDLHIDWAWEPHAETAEFPVLHVHNKSNTKIVIGEIRFLRGAFWRRPVFGTAVSWDDPIDLPFPAPVEPGQMRGFRISEDLASKYYDKSGRFSKAVGWLRRSAIWIEIRTVGRSSFKVGAEDALPWKERPAWRKLNKESNDA